MPDCFGEYENVEYVLLDVQQTIEHTLTYLEQLRNTVAESVMFD